MLALPEKGLGRSVNEHNVDSDLCADWIEACALFDQSPLLGSQFVDVLVEAQVYETQDFAWGLFDMLCSILERRQRALGEGYPLRIDGRGRKLVKKSEWQEYTPYSFCLLLSLFNAYPDWARRVRTSFSEQGRLFEELSEEALQQLLPTWRVHRTGWSATKADKLAKVVKDAAEKIGDNVRSNFRQWMPPSGNDGGLDLVVIRPFLDGRGAHVTYLVQCASGANWEDKLHTPNLDLWGKLIEFAVAPRRGFSIPFALPEEKFRRHALTVQGVFLDRYRLLSAGHARRDWLSGNLTDRLNNWTNARVSEFPRLT